MRALILEAAGLENLRLQEIAAPSPQPGEALVRLHASALNRRDLAIITGKHANTKLPCVLGADGAGVVEAIGEGVDASLLGREVVVYPAREWGPSEVAFGPRFRVLGMPDPGTFADYIRAPASDLYPKPAHLNWTQSAALALAGLTAWRAVITQGEVRAEHKVLISGAGGGVASFAIQWCARLGAKVYVTSGDDAKIAHARTLGALGGVSYRDPDLTGAIKTMVGGIDIVIDGAGGEGALALIAALKPGGRFVSYGATLGNPAAPLDLRSLFLRHIRLQGTTMGSPAEFAAMLDFVTTHKIIPALDRVFSLSQGAAALARLADFAQAGKIALDHSA